MFNNIHRILAPLFLLCSVMMTISCSPTLQEQVELALQSAGSNRVELERVLRYYDGQPLKQEAARFLIANMPFHQSYRGWEIDSMKCLIQRYRHVKKMDESVQKRWKDFDYQMYSIPIKDVHVVKSDMLIDNIDLAFEVWEKRPWSKRYTFADFCEYVLPYRVGDEPVENWRRTYYERYSPVLDSLYQGNDVVEAARVMANFLKAEGFVNRKDFDIPHLGAMFLLDTRVGYCRENCDIASYVMRALGIPVTMDFYEMSPSYNSRHFWSALIDTTGLAVPFNYTEKEISRLPDTSARKKGKVYRLCYGAQPEKLEGMYQDSSIPSFFRNRLLRDASEEYFPGSEVEIRLDACKNTSPSYLCVFTGRELKPVDLTSTKRGTATFRGVEPGLIYFAACRKGNIMAAASYPFMPRKGEVHYFVPDTFHRESVTLMRKYPMRDSRKFLGTASGVVVEGANRRDFADRKVLCYVADTPRINYNVLYPAVGGKFRYIRYTAPSGKRTEIGEWRMFAKGGEQPLNPVSIVGNPPLNEFRHSLLPLMSDGDWSSFYLSEEDGEQLVFDLGRPVALDHILFIPRTDDNFVHPGDVYELFYHAGASGWKSLGRQQATGTELHYECVPRNAVLWLHDHTRGKEERCFYMENGRQVFM